MGKELDRGIAGNRLYEGTIEKTEKAVTWNGGGQYRNRGERRDK